MGVSDRLTDNDMQSSVNRVWTAPNAEDVEILMQNGTDTDSKKFLNKGSDGSGYNIVADKAIEIISVKYSDTELYLGDPIQIAADTRRVRALKHPNFSSMTIRILTINTIVQLEVF